MSTSDKSQNAQPPAAQASGTPPSGVKKLGVIGLAAIVVSSMIGGGIYSLPQNMASGAGAGAVIIAWIVTGIGIYFIANTFRTLSAVKPDLTAGVYMYSRQGFGQYAGFTIAWGYWLCQIFGNVGYAVITMDALNYFFPGVFTGGNNLYSIIGGSILIWTFNFVVLAGVRQASVINLIGTVGKLIPLAIFIIAAFAVFHWKQFTFDFWGNLTGHGETNLGSVGAQIKSTMLVTLWAFIGIEGAVVMSSRAKSQSDVGKATLLGFFGCLSIYILLSLLPYGFMTQADLAGVANPSTAGVLEAMINKLSPGNGAVGAVIMNCGLLVAVLASWLSWTMITAELPAAAAADGTFPKQFARENKNGSPSVSLFVTSALMQLAMLMVYFSSNAWNFMLDITGVMVLPAYFASTLYLWKISQEKGLFKGTGISARLGIVSGFVGTFYALWLIYAAGVNYLLMEFIFLALGIPVFIWARRQKAPGERPFSENEGIAATVVVVIALFAVAHAAYEAGFFRWLEGAV